MRVIFALILIIGMGLAGFAVYMAQGRFSEYQSVLEDQRRELAQNVPMTRVFVSNVPLRYGHKLVKEDVRWISWPTDAVPEGAFTDPDVLFENFPDVQRSVLRSMEKDEAIMAVKVTEPGAEAGVASRLGKGMRAFTIRVDVASGVSGFLRAGDRVDVYWTGRIGDRDVTRLILEDLKLIAIDQSADEDQNNPTVARTVTAEVSPTRVAALAQAQATGRLLLSLRGTADDTSIGEIEIDQDSLLGIVAPEIERAPEVEKVCTIKTRKGAEVIIIEIPCPAEE